MAEYSYMNIERYYRHKFTYGTTIHSIFEITFISPVSDPFITKSFEQKNAPFQKSLKLQLAIIIIA